MKKIAILTLLLSTGAFAHEATPETKFFQEEVKKNPMIGEVLTWCSLIGLDSEEACKSEMYKNNELSDMKISAAAKCVEKSGLKFRVALDNFFKESLKDQSLVSHQDPNTGRFHTRPMKDPAHPKDPEHYYFYTAVDRQESAFKKGDEFVARLKQRTEETLNTMKVGSELTVGAKADFKVVEANTELKGIIEKAVSQGSVKQEDIKKAAEIGEAYGRSHPEASGDRPHGYCVVGAKCDDGAKLFAEDQLQGEVEKDVLPKPEAPRQPELPKEKVPEDPFGPFTSGTATGGMEADKPSKEKDKPTTTLIPGNEKFIATMNDCISAEENNILKNEGAKTEDQDAKTDEEKKADAEQQLSRGICDSIYFGEKFCADWKNEQAKSQAQNAEADKQVAYEEAIQNWQANGICDSVVLGFAFCQNAHSLLVTTPTDSESPDTGTIEDGVSQPDSSVPVDGGHISIDPNAWHPPETSVQPE